MMTKATALRIEAGQPTESGIPEKILAAVAAAMPDLDLLTLHDALGEAQALIPYRALLAETISDHPEIYRDTSQPHE